MSKPKEPTRAQLSSRLAYSAQTPAFLQKLQRKIAGQDDDDEDPEYEDYDDGSGRPPIPRRPAIPTRPDDDPGSADEDDEEEGPQIVVLREGKHLSERDVVNEKRKAKGLPPLPQAEIGVLPSQTGGKHADATATSSSSKQTQPLSFSSSGTKSVEKKRKAVGDGKDNGQDDSKKKKQAPAKKPKKAEKKLLSFDEDA